LFCFYFNVERKSSEALQAERDIDPPSHQIVDLGRAITSTGNDEVSESKQMLFKKYLGDQRQIQKFKELRTFMKFTRDNSDDAISSNYPNSSYSTMRDLTSSSINSILANSPSTYFDDSETQWREIDQAIQEGNFKTPAESFRKFNKEEEMNEMKQFERLWRKNEEQPTRDLLTQQKLMENFLLTPKNRYDSENSGNISESDHSFSYQKSGNISDSSPSTVISYSHRKTRSSNINIDNNVDQSNSKSSEFPSFESSLRSGIYSRDHLSLANRFGTVLKTMRKPGHHVGPVKNPSCLCETCKRFMLERDQVQGRERAFSFGDTPITQSTFWRKNNRYFV
jgi:hypothetical protein